MLAPANSQLQLHMVSKMKHSHKCQSSGTKLSTPGNASPNITELNFECVSATAILVDQNLLILTSLIDSKIQKYTWDSGLGPQQKQACTSWDVTERLIII